jgi:hypothetical protein
VASLAGESCGYVRFLFKHRRAEVALQSASAPARTSAPPQTLREFASKR